MNQDYLQKILDKKEKLDKMGPIPLDLQKNLQDWFRVELTYSSNAIEGNTLTRQETAQIVEKDITVEGKTLQEHIEAKNTAQGFDFILKNKDKEINENLILDIHKIILQKIDDHNAGKYRNIPVRIAGSRVILPNPVKVPDLMQDFVKWIKQTKNKDPVELAINAHYKLVSIHPFVDGNGRTARLLMNLILLSANFPVAMIEKEQRNKYIKSIEKYQLENKSEDYYNFMLKTVEKGLDIYLEEMVKIKK
ncbi:Fic family protein [Patescibacteria group bacterium]|nr:Fic family protein [Patescibacteria group bacterium]